MARVIWTDRAVDDLQKIVDAISPDSPQYAGSVSGSILEAVDRLVDFPEIGRMLLELQNRSVREVLASPYRIIYWRHGEACEIIAIIHGSRDLLRHLPSGPWDVT